MDESAYDQKVIAKNIFALAIEKFHRIKVNILC